MHKHIVNGFVAFFIIATLFLLFTIPGTGLAAMFDTDSELTSMFDGRFFHDMPAYYYQLQQGTFSLNQPGTYDLPDESIVCCMYQAEMTRTGGTYNGEPLEGNTFVSLTDSRLISGQWQTTSKEACLQSSRDAYIIDSGFCSCEGKKAGQRCIDGRYPDVKGLTLREYFGAPLCETGLEWDTIEYPWVYRYGCYE